MTLLLHAHRATTLCRKTESCRFFKTSTSSCSYSRCYGIRMRDTAHNNSNNSSPTNFNQPLLTRTISYCRNKRPGPRSGSSFSNFSSTSSNSGQPEEESSSSSSSSCLSFSSSSLGLEHVFVTPTTLASIKQLPEVESALKQFPSSSSVDELKRASQVFDSFQGAAASEQLAVYALLVECQQRLALYDKALASLDGLDNLISSSSSPHNKDDLILARAKILWTKGDFLEAQQLCESVITQYDDLQESFPTTTNLHLASALTGKALSQLAAMETMDDAYSVRDYFRIAVKFLERHPSGHSNNLPEAAVLNNYGVAESVYALFLEETNNVSMPFTVALKQWFQGLQKLKGGERGGGPSNSSDHLDIASQILQAKIQCNMAWAILNYEHDQSDRLSKASDCAGKSLKVYDSISGKNNDGTTTASTKVVDDGLTRTLSILGACFQQSDNAVTAEGLFQSAVDKKKKIGKFPDTVSLLELKGAYRGYAELCSKWEKRDGDVQRLKEEIRQLEEELLPPGWKTKSDLFSGLWFWTPGDVRR